MLQTSVRIFSKDTLVKGKPTQIECVEIAGQTFSISRGLVTTVRLEDEWFQEVDDPSIVIDTLLRDRTLAVDIFSFCQRLPNIEPRFPYMCEWDSIAAIRIETYDDWWNKLIAARTRTQIRKSLKQGVVVRERVFDDEFVLGMTSIFNETPIRQGRRFWHYGKDAATVRQQFSRGLFREDLIGAYYENELIGFAMIAKSRAFAELGQIISKVAHRDKATTILLIAKAVELCVAKRIEYLLYGYWANDSLGEFKRRAGFREVKLPRYFVPLSAKGRWTIRTGAHRGLKALLPAPVAASLKTVRGAWYGWREDSRKAAGH